jgi:hypothetical protein
MKKPFYWLSSNWQPLVLAVISILVLLFVGFYKLESITNSQLSPQEVANLETASSVEAIINNPLFLPYKVGQFVIFNFIADSIYLARALVALFGVGLVLLFYLLARHWFSPRIAWMTSLMLATSGLFLNFARLAVPDILLPLALLALLGCAWWLNTTNHIRTALFGTVILCTFALYIPGIIWFVILAIFTQHRHVRRLLRHIPSYSTAGFAFVLLVLLLPLFRAFYLDPSLILSWLALPTSIDLAVVIKEFIFVPASLIVRSLSNPVFNLGRLPYIDILTICLAILGFYAFILRFELVRTKTLIGSTVIAWALIAVSDTVSIVIILPLLYLTVASGIMLLLHQWFTIFPKNPIARFIGITLVLTAISISLFYNINRYYMAWANSPVTNQSFEEKLPANLLQ